MALLDQILGDLVNQAHDPNTQSKILETVQSALNSSQGQALTEHVNGALAQTPYGSLHGLVDQLQKSGLADHVASWLSGGPNTPLDAKQVESALAPGLDAIGSALGLPQNTLSGVLSQLLPAVIDTASPAGTLQTPAAPAPAPTVPAA